MEPKETAEEVEVVEGTEEVVEEVEGEETVAEDKEIPAFLDVDDDEGQGEAVPVGVIGGVRKKYRAKLTEKDEENEKLRKENELLKQSQQQQQPAEPVKRPRITDFDSDEDYEEAMDKWESQRTSSVFTNYEQKKNAEQRQRQEQEQMQTALDDHYSRVDKLVSEHSIEPEVYRTAEQTVKQAAASSFSHLAPSQDVALKVADSAIDKMITNLGEGSEKVMLYLGRNKAKLNEFRAMLQDDPSGLRAAVFLGKISSAVSGTRKRKSQAPAPAPQVGGDGSSSAKVSAMKRKYDAAHSKGRGQEAYNLKKSAKAAGHDVSKW